MSQPKHFNVNDKQEALKRCTSYVARKRKQLGMTQYEMADRIPCCRGYISMWEQGKVDSLFIYFRALEILAEIENNRDALLEKSDNESVVVYSK